MRQSVANYFRKFTLNFEGDVPFMYLDRLGYVTTGKGNKIDPYGPDVYNLPWKRSDGSLATEAEVHQAWNAVKAAQSRKDNGGGTFGDLTTLRLTSADIDTLVMRKLAENENYIRSEFPSYDSWPADAQLAVLSMAWAMGAGFSPKYPKFTRAVNAVVPDFTTAANESHMTGVGIDGRNAANAQLLRNAATVISQGLDPTVLYYAPGAPLPAPASPSNNTVAGISKKLGPGSAGVLLLLCGVAGAGAAYAWHKGFFT